MLRALSSDEVARSRAVIVTGGNRMFSAGAGIAELRELTSTVIAVYYRTTGVVYGWFAEMSMSTVAAIGGYCLGGGLKSCLAADLRVVHGSGPLRSASGLPRVKPHGWCAAAFDDYPWPNKPMLRRLLEPKQFTSEAFAGLLKGHKIAIDMDGKGCWRDNVFVERL